ncbi:member of the karyopherin-beta [Exophiala oligosperma]
MERLVLELNDPGNQAAPERIHDIQRQIQRLQRDRSAWQGGLDLLQHDEALLRFYGALTLTIKINADWDNDGIGKNDQMREQLLGTLVNHYSRLVTLPDSNFVLQKLCSTLVTFFAKPDSGWQMPIRHVLACLMSGQYVPETALPDMQQLLEATTTCSDVQLRGILMLVRIMAEDLTSNASSAAIESSIADRLAANCLDTWQLLEFSLHRVIKAEHKPDGSLMLSLAPEDMFHAILQAMPFWTGSIKHGRLHMAKEVVDKIETIAKGCIAVTMNLFDRDFAVGDVLQLLLSLQQVSPGLLRESAQNYPASIADSHAAKIIVDGLVRGDFSPNGILYVDLLESIMSQVDTSTRVYLDSRRYHEIIQTLRRLLRCDGIAVIEDPVCQIALEKVTDIVEGSTDWEQDQVEDFIYEVAADACDACLIKVKIPEDQMSNGTSDWDADDRAKFQDFRYDVHDFFQSAFTVLGTGVVQGIVKTIISQGTTPDWSTFEAAMFCLTAYSDTMASEPEVYDELITTVLGSHPWGYVLTAGSTVPDRARQTCIRFIADSVVYLQRHSESMTLVLNFLFSSLHLQASASAASKAIYSLCDSHRRALMQALPQFMASLMAADDLGATEEHRLYAAVAAIVQALPSEEHKIEPLRRLLSSIRSLNEVLTGATEDEDELLRLCIDAVQTLASIGKGLRSPHDVPIDLEPSADEQAAFWHTGPGADLQLNVLDTFKAIIHKAPNQADVSFIEACCDFIRSGFTEQNPSPFKFPDLVALDIVVPWITISNPSIDMSMACASSFLASAESRNIQSCVRGVLHQVATNQELLLSTHRRVYANQYNEPLPSTPFSSASLDFLARTLLKFGSTWFASPDSLQTGTVAIELALLVMAESDTLPRRSASSFFATLVDCSGRGGPLDTAACQTISDLLQTFGSSILSMIVRLLGGECARSEIESLTDALKKFIQRQPMLSKLVLREAVKQEAGVMSEKALQTTTIEQRNRFVAQVEGLRGGRKTNDVVKEFWISCKGSGFGYIA